jgi:hypothetical protein
MLGRTSLVFESSLASLSLQELNQASQAGESLALPTARALKGSPPDLLLAILGLPEAKKIGVVTRSLGHRCRMLPSYR